MYAPCGRVSQDGLNRGLERLDHRGSDGSETWFSNVGTIGLDHSQLSIIDLTTGDQTIANEEDQIAKGPLIMRLIWVLLQTSLDLAS